MKLTQKLPSHGCKHPSVLKGILSMSLLLICLITNAQFIGWPNNSGAQATEEDVLTKTITTTEYTDNDRVRVTASTQISFSPDQYELDVSAPSGMSLSSLSFPAGKWCLLIQMEDPSGSFNVGQHCRGEVVSFNSSTGKLVLEIPSTNTYPALTFATNSRVQLLRVPVWRTINLESGGELTCAPYNHADGTGGIVAVVAGSILNFKGGIINASGKGYHVGGSYTLGTGGAGQNAASAWTGGTLGFSYGPYPYPHNSIVNGNPPPAGFNPLLNGYMCSQNLSADAFVDMDISGHTIPARNGGDADNTLIAGSSTSGTIDHYFPSNPVNSSAWSILMMGNSGDPGANGGNGAGGGGYGGTGGNNLLGIGTAGVIGQNGGVGGNAGDASRGGGIVLLKINSFSKTSNITSTRKMIFADGRNGNYGTNGGAGGDGGEGGLGADGGCNGIQIVPPGSIGGYGQSGIGAKGGTGGDGGECGAVWLMKRSTGALSGHVSLRGGKGGAGGAGGYSKDYLGLPLAMNWLAPGLSALPCNLKNYYMCYPTYSCPDYEVCDCDKVFEQLKDIGSGFTISNSSMPYSIDKTGFESVWYTDDYNNDGSMVKALYFTDLTGACPVKYKCVMARQELYKDMLDKMYKKKDLQTYIPATGTTYKVGVNTISLASGNVELDYYDGTKTWKVLQYRPSVDELEDKDDPNHPIVYAMNCDFSYPNGSGGYGGGGGTFEPPRKNPEVKLIKTGDDGDDGGDEPDGDGDPDYFAEDDNAPFIGKKPLTETTDLISVHNQQHSSATSVIEVELITKETIADYLLYDISGKLIEKGRIEGKKQFSGLPKGIYVLVVKTSDATDVKKLQF